MRRSLALPEPLKAVGRIGVERSSVLYGAVRGRVVAVWSRSDEDVAEAWSELVQHPELSWVPPMWRTVSPTTEASVHAVSAVEQNLKVDIVHGPRGRTEVRLMTGKLHDRKMGQGVDPMTPMVSVDPKLTVTAPTFEKAVLELRDAVVETYGAVPAGHVRGGSPRRVPGFRPKWPLPPAH